MITIMIVIVIIIIIIIIIITLINEVRHNIQRLVNLRM